LVTLPMDWSFKMPLNVRTPMPHSARRRVALPCGALVRLKMTAHVVPSPRPFPVVLFVSVLPKPH